MSRFAQWLAISVGVHIGAAIYSALWAKPVDWSDPLHAALGAGLALGLFKERSNDKG